MLTYIVSKMKHILIVEDNANMCDLLTIIITRLGYEVAVAVNGEEAVERASAIRPELILMDIGLPKLNGIEATRQIKADPSTKDIPVVILTALPMFPHGTRGIEAGAVEVLHKPFSFTDIRNVLIKYASAGSKPPMESAADSTNANPFHPTNILH